MKPREKRSLGREYSFKFIFHFFFEQEKTVFNINDEEILREEIEERMLLLQDTIDIKPDNSNFSFIYKLISGTIKHTEELEKNLSITLKNWRPSRISKVEHTLLLLSSEEIIYSKDVPPNVIMNEYIELAKKFGGKESGSFLNGVLNAIFEAHNLKIKND